jgi:1-acyl-sn-glycerol-3-phosphate acyltransferase
MRDFHLGVGSNSSIVRDQLVQAWGKLSYPLRPYFVAIFPRNLLFRHSRRHRALAYERWIEGSLVYLGPMEGRIYRFIVMANQYLWWLLAHVLLLRYEIHAYRPAGLFEDKHEHCLILASSHKSVLDPWLIMLALRYRYFRSLVPVRTLATQTFVGRLSWLNWCKPLVLLVYRLAGVIELPPENKSDGFHPETIRRLLVALGHGDVVAIFPEGQIWKKKEPPIGEFASGVV